MQSLYCECVYFARCYENLAATFSTFVCQLNSIYTTCFLVVSSCSLNSLKVIANHLVLSHHVTLPEVEVDALPFVLLPRSHDRKKQAKASSFPFLYQDGLACGLRGRVQCQCSSLEPRASTASVSLCCCSNCGKGDKT